MPTDLVQQFFVVSEIALLLIGLLLVVQILFNRHWRMRWLGTNLLPVWRIEPAEFAIYVLLFFAGGFLFQTALRFGLGSFIAKSPDRPGLEVMIYGTGLDGGALIAWMLFPLIRRHWYASYGTTPVPEFITVPALPWPRALVYGIGTVTVGQLMVAIVSAGWLYLLKQLGLPDDPQDAVAIFSGTKSPLVLSGMLVVACALAPMMEELLFRAGLYRFCRDRLGRATALLVSGILFGALHANWAGFLPLAAFGVVLALAYEATGSIRVPVIAHALFNLMTILFLILGVQPS